MPYEVSFHVVFHTHLSRFADSDRLQPSGRSDGRKTFLMILSALSTVKSYLSSSPRKGRLSYGKLLWRSARRRIISPGTAGETNSQGLLRQFALRQERQRRLSRTCRNIAKSIRRRPTTLQVSELDLRCPASSILEHSLNCRPDPGHRCPSDLKKTPHPHIGIAVQI